MSDIPVITAKNLSVNIDGVNIIEDIAFSVGKGKILALVGESGCGKSMTALSVMHLLPSSARIAEGSILLNGNDITHTSERGMQEIRGNEISMIFQEPATDLDPLMTVGKQITEAIQAHCRISRQKAEKDAVDILCKVGIPDPVERLRQYPFELSGGMCQRIMIATALVCKPAVLLADEPTTALDVTIQAQILDLIKNLAKETGTSVILITHDMGVVADMADEVAVMYAGKIVETGEVHAIFDGPKHPYTSALLSSIPSLTGERKKTLHIIPGIVPEATAWPTGCRFHTRCPYADDLCKQEKPGLESMEGEKHYAACWHTGRVSGGTL